MAIPFIEQVNQANRLEQEIAGSRVICYQSISHDPELSMYILSAGHSVMKGNEGGDETNSYYFDDDSFVPVLNTLNRNRPVRQKIAGYQVATHSHTKHDCHSSSAIVQKGTISISLSLDGLMLSTYNLLLEPGSPKSRQIVLDTAEADAIRNAIRELQ